MHILITGMCKKQEFGRSGGREINSYLFTFLGRLIQISPLIRVKIEILVYKYSTSNIFLTVQNILFVSIYSFFIYFIYEYNIYPLLGQNILEKFNYDKIKYRVKLIQNFD